VGDALDSPKMDPGARTRILRYAAAFAVVLGAGLALIGLSNATALDVVGIVLVGAALVLAVSAVFLEIGLSEDREREAAERARRRRRG
jgi:heme A synthase